MGEAFFEAGREFFFGIRRYKKDSVSEKHYHRTFEIYYLEKGKCNYFIDDKCYAVKEGDIVLIPSGIIHSVVYLGEKNQRKLVECSYKYIPKSIQAKLSQLIYVYRSPFVRGDVIKYMEKIEHEFAVNDEFSMDVLRSLLSELLVFLTRNRSTRLEVNSGNEYVEKAVRYIKEHFSTNVALTDVANICHMSAEHLSRKFKQETGLGFNEYLNMLRLQKAEWLLKNEKNMTISEVAFACGFNDSNYFSKKFKQEYGYTPMLLKNGKIE